VKIAAMVKLAVSAALCTTVAHGVPAVAQTTGATVFSSTQLDSQLKNMEAAARQKGSSGATLGDYGSHKLTLSVRSTTGDAEVHAHFDDVMLVMGGSATLITGGQLIDPKTDANGESKGTGIRDGVKQEIAAGDIIHIPAGTPHQLILSGGTILRTLVVKVRE
jgi:mannose-6-phosphate isomerase-like protein (cupin superfamily)